jgi:hypothetical protein
MTLAQRKVKQTIIASIYFIIFSGIIFIIISIIFPPQPVVVEDTILVKSLQVVKSGKIDLGNGKADFWAEISNPNDDYGVSKLEYNFIFKDSNGEEMVRKGNTFILPGDKKRYVLLLNLSSEYELQAFEVSKEAQWTQLSRFSLPELVIRNTSLGESNKAGNAFTVFGILTNSSAVNLKNIQVMAVIKDDLDNVIGVNQTLIRDVIATESRDFEMIWQNSLEGVSISDTQIYAQSNVLSDRELLLELQQNPIFDR